MKERVCVGVNRSMTFSSPSIVRRSLTHFYFFFLSQKNVNEYVNKNLITIDVEYRAKYLLKQLKHNYRNSLVISVAIFNYGKYHFSCQKKIW